MKSICPFDTTSVIRTLIEFRYFEKKNLRKKFLPPKSNLKKYYDTDENTFEDFQHIFRNCIYHLESIKKTLDRKSTKTIDVIAFSNILKIEIDKVSFTNCLQQIFLYLTQTKSIIFFIFGTFEKYKKLIVSQKDQVAFFNMMIMIFNTSNFKDIFQYLHAFQQDSFQKLNEDLLLQLNRQKQYIVHKDKEFEFLKNHNIFLEHENKSMVERHEKEIDNIYQQLYKEKKKNSDLQANYLLLEEKSVHMSMQNKETLKQREMLLSYLDSFEPEAKLKHFINIMNKSISLLEKDIPPQQIVIFIKQHLHNPSLEIPLKLKKNVNFLKLIGEIKKKKIDIITDNNMNYVMLPFITKSTFSKKRLKQIFNGIVE
jgi:hypothetical protein